MLMVIWRARCRRRRSGRSVFAEAKARLSELLKAVEAGERIVITRLGRRVATLEPVLSRPGPIDTAWVRGITAEMDPSDVSAALGGRDAVHAATALSHGFDELVTADRDVDAAPGLRRVGPIGVAL